MSETFRQLENKPSQGAPARLRDLFAEEDAPGFFGRHRVLTTILILLGVGGLGWGVKKLSDKPAEPRREALTLVALLPPPPPPPPPPVQPPPPPPEEQKMIEQTPVENEEPPEPKAVDEPPPVDIATGIKGDGPPDGFGIRGGGDTRPGGAGTGGTQQRSRWGAYASQVQNRIQGALRENRRTRAASLRVEVRIWPDATGRITRATLAGTTGDPALDSALRDEVLTGMQLTAPPPQDMPLPIIMRLTVRRPN